MSNQKPVTDDKLLFKYKNCGLSTKRIAERMGLTEKEVEERWAELMQEGANALQAGHPEFLQHVQALSLQYSLMGQQLVIVCGALANAMPSHELKKLLKGTPEQIEESVQTLMKNAIILRPFTPPDPNVLMQEHLQGSNISSDPGKN